MNKDALLYTFPFEGNWNWCELCWCCYKSFLAIHFPVWREWKLASSTNKTDVPSHALAIHFPVWRELKLTLHPSQFIYVLTCYTLSRLKGIETYPYRVRRKYIFLAIHFPVWREWKLCYSMPGIDIVYVDGLLYTFPFEGNGNTYGSSAPAACQTITCYTLSRLKGIETIPQSNRIMLKSLLAIHFPVWREWKLTSGLYFKRMASILLAIHFPVWRELKLGTLLWTSGFCR